MVGLSSIQMALENWTICHLTSFQPFQYWPSWVFRSPQYSMYYTVKDFWTIQNRQNRNWKKKFRFWLIRIQMVSVLLLQSFLVNKMLCILTRECMLARLFAWLKTIKNALILLFLTSITSSDTTTPGLNDEQKHPNKYYKSMIPTTFHCAHERHMCKPFHFNRKLSAFVCQPALGSHVF